MSYLGRNFPTRGINIRQFSLDLTVSYCFLTPCCRNRHTRRRPIVSSFRGSLPSVVKTRSRSDLPKSIVYRVLHLVHLDTILGQLVNQNQTFILLWTWGLSSRRHWYPYIRLLIHGPIIIIAIIGVCLLTLYTACYSSFYQYQAS
jgi:hypothetical protein